MYSSVKFFEPTVSVTLPLSGLDWIRLAVSPEAPVVVLSSSLPPHAVIVTARIAATNGTKAARTRRPLITRNSFPAWTVRPIQPITGILCGAGGALQLQALRGHEPLDAGQCQLDR